MAWLGEGLSSLSSLKGQITSFTKEVLSDGIVNEIDDGRSKNLEEANAKCSQLEELLNSKEAEISILRRQNSELQKAVVEFRSKPNDSRNNNGAQEDDSGGAFFWDPQPQPTRTQEVKNQTKVLQDQLDQATVKIRDLESELGRLKTLNSSNVKDDANFKEEGPSQKTELLRAKQDVMNRIIQIGEKSREVERNAKRLQQDEQTLVGDLRSAISKLASAEQYDLVRSALAALEHEQHQRGTGELEKSESAVEARPEKDLAKLAQESGQREVELLRRIRELEADNQNLSSSMEELDRQSSESIERVLAMKEELQKKHHSLQSAYEQLYVEYNQVTMKFETLQQQQQQQQQQQAESVKALSKECLDSAVQTFTPSMVNKQIEATWSREDKECEATWSREDKECETMPSIKEDKGTEVEPSKKLDQETEAKPELEMVREVLKNSTLESLLDDGAEEAPFVKVAKQLVELKWKQDTLERKLTEQSRELKEAQELRDALQLDCEDMQGNIESLLLEIQRLKSNMPTIPEASEERVASLETETESLQEEIRSLRRTNADMRRELKAIKEAVREADASVDTAKLEALLAASADRPRELDSLKEGIRDAEGQIDLARVKQLFAASGPGPRGFEAQELGELLQAALDENTSLRRRIDGLESQLRVSLERCKGIDDNIETIEELKLDLENARRELKILGSNNKRLENSLALLQEAKAEADADNEVLQREKEQLEADLKLLRESDLKRDEGEALAELREQLAKAREERNDLEYDIGRMREELDHALEQLEERAAQEDRLRADAERLARENDKLVEQFAEAQSESADKLELLNTETTLLQQELDSCKEELEAAAAALGLSERRAEELEEERARLADEAARVEAFESENRRLSEALEATGREASAAMAELRTREARLLELQQENAQLSADLARIRGLDEENRRLALQVQEKCDEISKSEERIGQLETKLKCAETYTATLESEHQLLEDKLEKMEAQLKKSEAEDSSEKLVTALQLDAGNKIQTVEVSGEQPANYPHGELEKLKALEVENGRLRTELNELLLKKDRVAEADGSELVDQLAEKSEEIAGLKATIAKDQDSAQMARETVENLSQLISAKDQEISRATTALAALGDERDKLVKLVQEKHAESLQYHAEIQRLNQLLNEQSASLQKLAAERDSELAALKDKEAQLLWTQNELQVAKQRLQNLEESERGSAERCGLPEHSLLAKRAAGLEERNKALEAALIQDQSNLRYLREQLTEAQSKEAQALKEVERLRNHLVEIEKNYTEEALQSEEIRNTLEARLVQAEEKLKNSSTMYTSASVRANQQVETLQQQLALMVQQRDDLQNKISAAEDKVLSYSASLTNLQLVLEQFQRDKEKDIHTATEKLRIQLNDSHKEQAQLRDEILNLKAQLLEAKEALRAATRLTDELEKKSERIEQLNQEVKRLTELVNTADQRIEEAKKSGEGKVDRTLVKNLLLGYISSPPNDKSSVLRVCANVLDFNETEREKSGLNGGSAKNSWFASLVNSGSPSSKEQEVSLSTAFIKFLESESQPKPQLPALPISNSPISRPSHSRQHSSSSTSSILLTNVTLPTFPDFVPARNTGSILKEVLKDS